MIQEGAKLIRDKLYREKPHLYDYRTADIPEFLEYLREKLKEETSEFFKEKDEDKAIKEIADILEVIEADSAHYKIKREEVLNVQEAESTGNKIRIEQPAKKLVEDYLRSSSDKQRAEKTAAILNILVSYAENNNIAWDRVLDAKRVKKAEKGVYNLRVISTPKKK